MEKTLDNIRQKKKSIRQAAEYYDIPKSTLTDKINNKHPLKLQGGQTILSEAEEKILSDGIKIASE